MIFSKGLEVVSLQQLKAIQQNYWKQVAGLRSRRKLSEQANRLVTAINQKRAFQITGDEMFNFVKQMSDYKLILNYQEIQTSISSTNNVIEWLLFQSKYIISQTTNQLKLTNLLKTNNEIEIMTRDCQIHLKDNAILMLKQATQKNNVFNCHVSIYLRHPLDVGYCCSIKIVSLKTGRKFFIGVDVADDLNESYPKASKLSILYESSGTIYQGKTIISENVGSFQENSVVIVFRHLNTIQWLIDGFCRYCFTLSNHLSGLVLFPVFRQEQYYKKNPTKLMFI